MAARSPQNDTVSSGGSSAAAFRESAANEELRLKIAERKRYEVLVEAANEAVHFYENALRFVELLPLRAQRRRAAELAVEEYNNFVGRVATSGGSSNLPYRIMKTLRKEKVEEQEVKEEEEEVGESSKKPTAKRLKL
jgi:hypothetical protein